MYIDLVISVFSPSTARVIQPWENLPWSAVASRVPPIRDGSHVVWRFWHLISCESLWLLGIVGWGHGGVCVSWSRCTMIERATLCRLGHPPHRGHYRQGGWTLISCHPTSTGITAQRLTRPKGHKMEKKINKCACSTEYTYRNATVINIFLWCHFKNLSNVIWIITPENQWRFNALLFPF